MESALAADPTDATDRNDPIEPTDRTDPTEPTDRTEPFEPMHSNESWDHSDHREFFDAMGSDLRFEAPLVQIWFVAGNSEGNAMADKTDDREAFKSHPAIIQEAGTTEVPGLCRFRLPGLSTGSVYR